MKVALVHDQISEYGGAERVLEALCEMYPEAPIYTAFYRKDSVAWQHFKHRKIIASWAQNIPFFSTKKKSSGIVLSLCKQIVMLHKRSMHVQSIEGKG